MAAVRTGLVLTVVLSATIAAADVDMSGAWGVKFGSPPNTFVDWFATQSGTTFSMGGFSGTIDPTTGAFSGTSNAVPCPGTIDGTVAPDSKRFTATVTMGFLFHGFCVSFTTGAEGRRCGNGILDPGEVCDDHNFDDGDCCDSTCSVQQPAGAACDDGNPCTTNACDGQARCAVVTTLPDDTPCDDGFFCDGPDRCVSGTCVSTGANPCAGGAECARICNETLRKCADSSFTSCTDDGVPCTTDHCDGAGQCVHTPTPAGGDCPDDGHACTWDYCDAGGTCIHPPKTANIMCRPNTLPCDVAEYCDGVGPDCPTDVALPPGSRSRLCPPCETCDEAGLCAPAPQSTPLCARSVVDGRARLVVQANLTGSRNRLAWDWRRGAATTTADFGTPDNVGDDYRLCGYDLSGPSSELAFVMNAPAGGSCGATSCWTRTQRLLTYRDKAGTSDGLQRLDLRPGAAGSAQIKLRARGANLTRPTLPAGLPLVLQLQSDQGGCWESRFEAARTNTAATLGAAGD